MFLKHNCYTIVFGCSYVELLPGIDHNNQIITLLLNHEWRHNKMYECMTTFLISINIEKQLMSRLIFNVHHSYHVFHSYTKVTVTSCKDSPCVCEWPWLCLVISPLHPLLLVSPLSFLSLLFLLSPLSALLSSSSRSVLSIVLHTHYICVNTRLTGLCYSLLPVSWRARAAVP